MATFSKHFLLIYKSIVKSHIWPYQKGFQILISEIFEIHIYYESIYTCMMMPKNCPKTFQPTLCHSPPILMHYYASLIFPYKVYLRLHTFRQSWSAIKYCVPKLLLCISVMGFDILVATRRRLPSYMVLWPD